MTNETGESGFTLVEVSAALALLALIALVLWSGFSTALEGGSKAVKRIKANTELLHADRLLREAAREIRIPFWENGRAAIEGKAVGEGAVPAVSIPFYRGEREAYVSIDVSGHLLTIQTPDAAMSVPLEGEKSLSFRTGDDGSVWGIELTVDGGRLSIPAPFGAAGVALK